MRKFIKTFKELTKKDVNTAGGKGASLGEMTNVGIIVPSGFVVLSNAFNRFMEETNLNVEIVARLKKVNYKDVNSVDEASVAIRSLIYNQKMPIDIGKEIMHEFKKLNSKFVAVRSSATAEDSLVASWAGELESYLDTIEKKLLENVKNCWSSLFTPRAIFYRYEKKMTKTRVSVAVVVQTMVESEISGITFTVHPVIKDRKQMIIEAGWGLGEAIVSGQITPDSYVVDKSNFSILDINVSRQEKMIIRKAGGGVKTVIVPSFKQEKQVLKEKQIIKLAKICVNIEKHYKKPQDIEWAYARSKFYIVQSRPITTL